MTSSSPRDSKRARLQARSLDLIWSGTQWLTAEQLAALRMDPAAHKADVKSQLQASEQLFWIRRDGQELFPRYVFSENFTPLPVMRDIMTTLQGWSAVMIAGWFESTSAFLQGRRPRELIESEPALVHRAAQDAVMHLSHRY